jgi:hypothetical protein
MLMLHKYLEICERERGLEAKIIAWRVLRLERAGTRVGFLRFRNSVMWLPLKESRCAALSGQLIARHIFDAGTHLANRFDS